MLLIRPRCCALKTQTTHIFKLTVFLFPIKLERVSTSRWVDIVLFHTLAVDIHLLNALRYLERRGIYIITAFSPVHVDIVRRSLSADCWETWAFIDARGCAQLLFLKLVIERFIIPILLQVLSRCLVIKIPVIMNRMPLLLSIKRSFKLLISCCLTERQTSAALKLWVATDLLNVVSFFNVEADSSLRVDWFFMGPTLHLNFTFNIFLGLNNFLVLFNLLRLLRDVVNINGYRGVARAKWFRAPRMYPLLTLRRSLGNLNFLINRLTLLLGDYNWFCNLVFVWLHLVIGFQVWRLSRY